MTQALSFWRQLINQLPEIKTGNPKQRKFKRFSEPGRILGFLTIIVAMLFWNWKLLLALAVGIGVMLIAYAIPKWNWQIHWLEIRRFLNSANSRLALAVASGGIATFMTYMAAAIWVDSSSLWLAVGAILQGFGTLLTLILLVWQIFSFHGNREEEHLEQVLNNLTETDPLKRLLAVRQLTKFITRKQVDASVKQDVIECLQLLLSREEEAVVRQAALNSLQTLDGLPMLLSSSAKPLVPISQKISTTVKQEVH
ncbi:armadillo-type fold-containing protein [Sphaerospermopsis torques-reginae]|uniref:Armadillo-type fold-containing protein n=1 Tax=Sphaerospermopsis torques-reginae ITEP-024 TaxID=984208 RepID=A0ABX8WUG4_9CYAN|nr:armadillo-type fold-containing protein [Sphaerospermopsis torques-reginae]QYX30042.1 armadillo-type fold-containing protein [Sphaerospermopsis torques-reginae ITEP-024]